MDWKAKLKNEALELLDDANRLRLEDCKRRFIELIDALTDSILNSPPEEK